MLLTLVYLTTLYLSCLGDPKSPRIYNVLISSKKNLSPSQALPVYEPVIRTTSLAYYPPLTIYSTYGQPYRVIPQFSLNTYPGYTSPQENPENQKSTKQLRPFELKNLAKLPTNQELPLSQDRSTNNNQNEEDGGRQPLPYEQFVPYYSPLLPNYAPQIINQRISNSQDSNNFEKISQNQGGDTQGQQPKFSIPRPENFPSLAQETDPKHAIANLRQKSDIPDVPPPPLPVRMKS